MRVASLKQTRPARWAVRHPVLSILIAGLSIRIVGGVAIWAADGHDNVFAKAIVIIGVGLSVFGIGVLKWLSMRPRRKQSVPAELDSTLPDESPMENRRPSADRSE